MKVKRGSAFAKWRGYRDGLGAAAVWGLAFVALNESVRLYGSIWARVLSFAMVGLVSIPLYLFLRHVVAFRFSRLLRLTMWPGIALGLCLCCQSIGIRTTSIANCGFITVLNIVFLPFGELLFFGKALKLKELIAIGIALAGAALMSGGLSGSFNGGDLVVLLSAMLGAVHFMLIGRLAKIDMSPFLLNATQFIWATLTAVVMAIALSEPVPAFHALPAAGIGYLTYLAYGSILIGFSLQIRAQRHLSPTETGLVCLAEAPIAAICGLLLAGQPLTLTQLMGAGCVLVASIVTLL